MLGWLRWIVLVVGLLDDLLMCSLCESFGSC